MKLSARLRYLPKALQELGLRQVFLFASYQLGLRSGYYRLRSPIHPIVGENGEMRPGEKAYALEAQLIELPHPEDIAAVIDAPGRERWMTAAEEILAGKVQLFGGVTAPLSLVPPTPALHWSAYASGVSPPGVTDIKFFWEPARFGWAYSLACAYHLCGDEPYAEAFWRNTETFLKANPPNLGPHWSSAQEVALRLIALVWSYQVFFRSPQTTRSRSELLARGIAAHADRLPLTLIYARAQNNNHLLSEAAGLFTAGLALPGHPHARRWRDLGMNWLNRGLVEQIAADGSYTQHSANYHRLMLQLAVWVEALLIHSNSTGETGLTYQVRQCLEKSTRWLLRLLDEGSGRAPNLGPNDGAYIQPLSVLPFEDFRPVLQAASRAFLGNPALPPGAWDELSLWLGQQAGIRKPSPRPSAAAIRSTSEAPHRLANGDAWVYLRVAHFASRPGHADQLHLDLWWRGLNLARDAGTYSYNDPPPWDNSLAGSFVHNTICVDGKDQMTRAGRFLWLDWAKARLIAHELGENSSWERLTAQHDGYRSRGVLPIREVTTYQSGDWEVVDNLHPAPQNQSAASRHTLRLHWLLPDWEWEAEVIDDEFSIRIRSPFGWVKLSISRLLTGQEGAFDHPFEVAIVRASELLFGNGSIAPNCGWFSPTYGVKEAALSVAVNTSGRLPLKLSSRWQFPNIAEG